MVTVVVTLFPPLREDRFSKKAVAITEPASLRSLLKHLDIAPDKVEAIYVNGMESGFERSLNDGDRVTFMPFLGGG